MRRPLAVLFLLYAILLCGLSARGAEGFRTTTFGNAERCEVRGTLRADADSLRFDLSALPPESKRKWLEIADKSPRLSPDGQARLQARMAEFSRLTPEQRRTARENFQRAYELPRESRESAVQQYQSLPDDRKKELTERSQRKDVARPGPKQ